MGLGLSAALVLVLAPFCAGCTQTTAATSSNPQHRTATPTPTVVVTGTPTSAANATPETSLSWSVVTSPSGSGNATNELASVSCPNSADCWAVGWNLIEQGTASGWNIVSAPDLPADGTLRSVACTSASDCWAVGYVTPNGGATQPLIEQGTDSGWTTVSSPSPSGSTDTELYSVTCASSGNCWAVGYNTAPTGGSQTLIEQDSGSGWSIVSSPNPAGVHGIFLYGVTCVGPSECWAVGSAGSQTLIEQETGGGWTIVPGATPPDSAGAQLVSVSCVSDGDCWAVGYSQALQVLIEEDTGSGWNIVDSPDITAAVSSQLEGVTCDGAGDCWAVGDYSTADGASEPLLFQEAGSGWIAASNPNSPGGAENSALDSVTCASATACWAVGSSWETGGATQTLIEQGT